MATQPDSDRLCGWRAARSDDFDYARSVWLHTMRARVEALVPWHPVQQEDEFRRSWRWTDAFILQYGKDEVGWFQLTESADGLHLHHVYLLPAWQRLGIGRKVIAHAQEEARRTRQPLRLRVLVNNPARRLYEAMGFRVARSDTWFHEMIWQP